MAHAAGAPMLDYAIEVTDLIDGVTGFLQAPVSQATLAALEEAASADVPFSPFL